MFEKGVNSSTAKEHPSIPLLDRSVSSKEMVVSELILAGLLGLVLLGKKLNK